MNEQCSKCGSRLSSPWKFCPHCGSTITQKESVVEAAEILPPAGAEKAPVQGAFTGLLFGMLAIPILVIVGTLLCLTGLGAILGIPMIAAAVFAPLLGPMAGIGLLKGKCPWCGAPVTDILHSKGFECHTCGQGIAVRNRQFVRVGS